MRARELRKLYDRAWPYTPAVREMHYRRAIRYDRLIRHYQAVVRVNLRIAGETYDLSVPSTVAEKMAHFR